MSRFWEPRRWSARALAFFLGEPDLEVIDVRGVDFFLGYIPGSRRFPVAHFDDAVGRLASELADSGKMVVFVDKLGGPQAMACAQDFIQEVSRQAGSASCKVYVLEGGFSAWEAEFAANGQLGRYVARAPKFPGAPYVGLLRHLPSPSVSTASPRSHGFLSEASLSDASAQGEPSGQDDRTGAVCEGCSAAQGAGPPAWQSAEPPASEDALETLALGDDVWIFRARREAWVRACVLASDSRAVRVQYLDRRGRGFVETVPRDAAHVRRSAASLGFCAAEPPRGPAN